MDSKLFTLHTIETFWNKIKNKFYVKSANGIPKSDLDTTVQSSLSKADSALQEHQDISGKQDKSTAVTHSTNTAVGSAAKPAYIAANGAATPISHSINADVPANAKFTDTTYGDATESTHGLMSAADKKKLDGMDLTKYLPKSGGVMAGDIDMQTNKKDILVGTHKATTSDGTAVAGGIIEKRANITSTIPEMRSFIGSFHNTNIDRFYSLISVRHRNGYNDGNIYGMYIFSDLENADGSLKWGKQTAAGTWTDDLVLLDSRNYASYALAKDGTAKKADCLSTGQLKFGYIYNDMSTATAGKTWARVAYCVVPKGYTTITMSMLVTSGNSGVGIFEIIFRNNANCDGFEYFNVKQIITNFPERVSINDIKAISKSTSDGMQYEIWYNIRSIYGTRQFTCLSEQLYSGANSNKWKFENHTAADFVSSPPADGTEATYKNCGVVSTAETLTDSGWVNMTLDSYSESGTVKYRIYGKQITITGEVVLKNNVATSYYAPQAIASTTLDFSKIVGCSGVGRSSSGMGVYVEAENFNGDNIVCVYALGGEIVAGKTLYFTITGFID